VSYNKEIDALIAEIREFAVSRDWEKFHTPKNLAMAIAGEAGELVAEFQWLKEEESLKWALSAEKFSDIELEVADVAIYLLRLSDVLEIDLAEVIRKKLEINETRF
jgi:NTP pyrophosphatase (non-canonical NTP hydrolase)